MNIAGVDGLIKDIEFAFGLPAVAYFMFLLNIKFSRYGKRKALMQRLSLIVVLLLFSIGLSTLMFQDRAVLIAVWEQNSILYSLVYLIASVLVITGISTLIYFELRPERWRQK